jgi:CRP/FNR family cyclic AMP-dependent transcriptional regulator
MILSRAPCLEQRRCHPECLLHSLSLEERREPAFRHLCYARRDLLCKRGDSCHQRVYVICQGAIGCYWGELGKQYLEILGVGDWIGEEYCSNGVWACEIRALTDVAGWWIEQAKWREVLRSVQELYERRWTERDQKRHEWEVVLAYGSVRARVAWQLLALAKRWGESSPRGIWVPLPLTQEQQAKLVGAARQTVTQVLEYFYKQGWIECEHRGFWIRDLARLVEQSHEGL